MLDPLQRPGHRTMIPSLPPTLRVPVLWELRRLSATPGCLQGLVKSEAPYHTASPMVFCVYTHVHMGVGVRGQPRVSFFRRCHPLDSFKQSLTPGSRVHLLGWAVWPEIPSTGVTSPHIWLSRWVLEIKLHFSGFRGERFTNRAISPGPHRGG